MTEHVNKPMSEEEIVAEYEVDSAFVGKRLYAFFVPVLEAFGAMNRMLELNRALYAIKNPKKNEPTDLKAV